jgi:SpoVK/Ycf46/Vps4 family AAA+-type ATPase
VKTTTDDKTAGAQCAGDIAALLRARNPLIWCVTREEARAERILIDAAAAAGYAPTWWDCANGITNVDGASIDATATDPAISLATIRDSARRQVFIMRDLHAWLRDPTVTRSLRSLCRTLPQAPRDSARAIVVVSPSAEVPPELSGHAILVDIPLPDRAEIAQLLDAAVSALPEDIRASAAPNGMRDAAIDAALGLSAEEAQSTFARSLIVTRRIDPATVANEKRRVIARERVLEWFDPLQSGLDGVGGLELLKAWLTQRRAGFTPQARNYGLRAPKGVLLVGVPGCGKSLSAKAIAAAWGMPLLRLDMGALRSKWVGESEANIRRALKVAETVAPAILWLDELEKALGGATQGAADGGVSSDALGVVLSWMQDRAGSVFVVATANDVSKLPPELLRKGRFDEVFFVDCPTAVERASIIRAALCEYGREVESIDTAAVGAATAEFTGAEIAALVPDAMFTAFADGERDVTTEDLVNAAHATVPLTRTAADKIAGLRQWATGRARPASLADSPAPTSGDRRAIDL